jgi:subtilisin family serine protease
MATVQVRYGGRGGRTYELETATDLVAVRTRDAGPVDDANLTAVGRRALDLVEPVVRFADAGVEVFHVRSGSETERDTVRAALRDEPELKFAGRVLADPVFDPARGVPATDPGAATAKTPILYSENLFVKFSPRVSSSEARSLLESYRLKPKRVIGYLDHAYFVEAPEGIGLEVFALALRLLEDSESVELCHPELLRPRQFRAAFPGQWHLEPGPVGGLPINAHAHVVQAWLTTRGAGATIAVIDTGIDIDHREFASAGKIVAPFNATTGTGSETDPRPRQARERHGTACAGVACADGRHGASGVAPAAKLMPIRLMSGLGSQDEADAIAWAADHGADVISCSWGPPDGNWSDPADPVHRAVVAMPDSTRLAVEHALANGRGGRGCVICFAAGNGNESVDNDGYASHPGIVAVAACNDRGVRSVYSDTGDALVCAFPSNDFAFPGVVGLPAPPPEGGVWLTPHPAPLTPGIWTTDRSGADGYNRGGGFFAGDVAGHYTNSFGGTSSACPGVAGVAALVLSVNPDLAHAEVRALLREACDRIDSANGRYDAVTGHSPLYGFGRLNAVTAVTLASAQAPDRAVAAPASRRARRSAVSRRGRSAGVSAAAFRDTGEKSKLSFTITGATSASVFVRPLAHPNDAAFLTMEKKDDALTGSIEVAAGSYEHTEVVQGGQPNGEATLKLQRDQRTPVEIPITLDSNGNGGRIGTITVE